MNNNIKSNYTGLIQLTFFSLLIAGIYYSTIEWLVIKDWARDDYSHGMLIPFIVIYLIWEKKNHLSIKPAKPSWTGFAVLVPGLVFFWLGELAGEFFALYISLWLIMVAVFWVHAGYERLKVIFFPLLLCLAMFPLPNLINVKLTFHIYIYK